jgi:HEAT repeat protein
MPTLDCAASKRATIGAMIRAACLLVLVSGHFAWSAEDDPVVALRGDLKSADENAKIVAIDKLAELGADSKDAVGDISALLKHKSPMVRAHAARALGMIGPPARSTAAGLAAAVVDPDAHVRRAAVHALETIDADPNVVGPALADALDDADPSVQVAALDALTDMGPAGVPRLAGALANPKTRYWAALALGELGPDAKGAVEPLTAALDEKRPSVLREVLIALGHVGPDAATSIPRVTPLLTHDDPSVRNAAAYTLGQMGPAAAASAAALREATKSKDELLPTVSAWALARVEPDNKPARDEAVKLLTAALEHENPRVLSAAIRGLLSLNVPPAEIAPQLTKVVCDCDPAVVEEVMDVLSAAGDAALPALIEAVGRPESCGRAAVLLERMGPKAAEAVPALLAAAKTTTDPVVRREILYALGSIVAGRGPADPALVAALDDPDEHVRATAAYALGRIGPSASSVVPKLRKAIESEDPLLRVVSAWALVHIVPDDPQTATVAVPVLAHGLKSESVDVRRGAATALGKLGKAAKTAVPALQVAARDKDETVRAAALEALEKVGAVVEKVPSRPVPRKK